MNNPVDTVYIVRRVQDGKYLGGGYWDWRDDPTKAKVYKTIGHAKGAITHKSQMHWRATEGSTYEIVPVEATYLLDQAISYP